MAKSLDHFIQRLRITLDPLRHTRDSDGQLLTRWLNSHDDRAFSALVCRHAAMVWRVSRGILRQAEDAEETFQATFLVLARKASSLQRSSSITGWLYQTAYHLALNARTAKLRRLRHEERACLRATTDPLDEISVREARYILAEELNRLSVVHREAILLCLYEGATQDEAAKRLGCSLNTLKRRLERGRSLLSSRLSKRGLAPENAFALTLCTRAHVPIQLLQTTITTASKFAAGEMITGGAAFLAEGALRMLLVKKLAVYCTLFVGLGSLTVAGAWSSAPGNQTHVTKATQFARPEAPIRMTQNFAGAAGSEEKLRLDADGRPLPPGAVERIGTNNFRYGGLFVNVLYMPGGKVIASTSSDGYLNSWDAAAGKLLWRFKSKYFFENAIGVSVDNKRLAELSTFDYTLLESGTGKLLVRHEWPDDNNEKVICLAISPDLGTLARGCRDASVRIYDAGTGQETVHITLGQNAQLPLPSKQAIEFSEDGKTIYVLTVQKSGLNVPNQMPQLMGFDTKNGKHIRTLEFPKEMTRPYRLVISPNHRMLAALERGRDLDRVVLWDLTTGKQCHLIEKQLSVLSCGAFSPDNAILAVGSQGTEVVLFDTTTGKELRRLHSNSNISATSLAFAPDGKTLACTNGWGCITLWDLGTGKPAPPSPQPNGVGLIQFVKNGNEIVSFGNSIDFWDVTSAKPIRSVALDPKWLISQSISPDGKLMVAHLREGDLVIINVATGELVRTLSAHKTLVHYTVFSPDAAKLFSAGGFDDPRILIWDVATGKQIRELRDHSAWVDNLAVSPDGCWLASAAFNPLARGDYDIRIWEIATGRLVHRLTPRRGSTFAMTFSADSSQLAAVGGEPGRANNSGEVQLWEVATGKEVRAFIGHQERVNRVTISADGRMLASSSTDNTLRLWETATGRERGRIKGYESFGNSLEFSPKGRLLAAVSMDAPIYLWDPYALEELKSPRTRLTNGHAQKLWQDLADIDSQVAFKSVCELIARPNETVGLLETQWQRLLRTSPKKMHKWIEELSSEQFTVRKNATAELERFKTGHEDLLRDALEKASSLEARQRLEKIVYQTDPQRLRLNRMLEVLEQLHTAPARQFLQTLAEQREDAVTAREAAASLKRLEQQK